MIASIHCTNTACSENGVPKEIDTDRVLMDDDHPVYCGKCGEVITTTPS